MTYNKPNDLTWTDIAIYFDNNFWVEDETKRDDTKLYQYTYLLLYMLACKSKYFQKFEETDQFSLLSATTVYMRMVNKCRIINSETFKILDGTFFDFTSNDEETEMKLKKKFAKRIKNFLNQSPKKRLVPNLYDELKVCLTASDDEVVSIASRVVEDVKDKFVNGKLTRYEFIELLSNSSIYSDYWFKSILNYCKGALYPLKLIYQNDTFAEVLNSDYNSDFDFDNYNDLTKEYVSADYDYKKDSEIMEMFERIPQMILDNVNSTMYKSNKLICKNLYISCMITILKSFTINKQDRDKLLSKEEKGVVIKSDILYSIYEKERKTATTLWHLTPDMTGIVDVIVNKVRKDISNELMDIDRVFELSDDIVKDIINQSYFTSSSEEFSNYD